MPCQCQAAAKAYADAHQALDQLERLPDQGRLVDRVVLGQGCGHDSVAAVTRFLSASYPLLQEAGHQP